MAKTNKMIAIKALAHKISRACYYIMKDNVNFDSIKLFGIPKNLDKGYKSKPKRGLAHNQKAPIGSTFVADKTKCNITQ